MNMIHPVRGISSVTHSRQTLFSYRKINPIIPTKNTTIQLNKIKNQDVPFNVVSNLKIVRALMIVNILAKEKTN